VPAARSALTNSALLRRGDSLRCRRARYNSGIGPSSALRGIHLDHRSLRAELVSALLDRGPRIADPGLR